jgi:predicted transcriptional regulator
MKESDRNMVEMGMLGQESVEDPLQRHDWHHEKIRKGIMAADRNDFASDEEVARVRAKLTVC